MKLFSTLAAVAAVVTAQDGGVQVQPSAPAPVPAAAAAPDAGRPPVAQTSAQDAGTPGPRPQPSPVVEAPPPDAGRPPSAAPAAPQQAAAPAPVAWDAGAPRVTAAPVVDNTAELQRVQAELQSQNAKLDSAVKELEALRAETEKRTAMEQQQQVETEAQRQAAVALGTVDQQLLTGNTEVGPLLDDIQGVLGPAALANLQAARDALANSDLTGARYFLARAAADAQAGR